MKPAITVIICTHNPRRDYIERVLTALKSQTLPLAQWELLLIDNASQQLLSTEIDLIWHTNARHIREEKLGLTPARLCGIKEASSETLVFVDDDNVLTPNYLEEALKISQNWPMLGAWGGQIMPEFEEEPPSWTKPYWWLLAIREFERDRWSNLAEQYQTTPCGAGLCLRKVVAEKYAELVYAQPERAGMDRKGKLLTCAGDMDMAFVACDLNLGTGQFTALKLTHLMPASRLQEDYLLKLREGESYSTILLKFFRGKIPPKRPWLIELLRYSRRWLMEPRKRRFYDATERGITLAKAEIYRNLETKC